MASVCLSHKPSDHLRKTDTYRTFYIQDSSDENCYWRVLHNMYEAHDLTYLLFLKHEMLTYLVENQIVIPQFL